MNTYLFYRRIRGPIFLLTFGVTALLNEWGVLGFSRSWPLYLIVAGVLRLAEGAIFTVATPPALPLYPATSYSSAPYPPVGGTALIPAAPAPLTTAGYQPPVEKES